MFMACCCLYGEGKMLVDFGFESFPKL